MLATYWPVSSNTSTTRKSAWTISKAIFSRVMLASTIVDLILIGTERLRRRFELRQVVFRDLVSADTDHDLGPAALTLPHIAAPNFIRRPIDRACSCQMARASRRPACPR